MTNIEKAEEFHKKGIDAYKKGDFISALTNLEKAVELKSTNVMVYILSAIILNDNFKEYEKARLYYERAIELDSNKPGILNNLAILLIEHFKDYNRAKELYEKALEINPKDSEILNNLGLLFLLNFKDFEKALFYFEKVVEFDSKNYQAYFNIATISTLKLNQHIKAKKNYLKAIELNPNYIEARINFANLLADTFKEYQEAKFNYEEAVRLNPKDGNVHCILANFLRKYLQDYNQAKVNYEKAISLNPKLADSYFGLAVLYEKNFQEYNKAKEYYSKCIEIEAENLLALNNLANLLQTHFQEYDKARNYYEKIIKIDSKYFISYYNLSFLLKEHYKDYKKANEYYQKARELDPFAVKRMTKISLKDYNQFKKGTIIDFTYPIGHPKSGEPLDRVCFIGQSGTGKSSILELIKSYISDDFSNTPNVSDESVLIQHKTYDHQTKTLLINFPPYSVENIKKLDADEILNYEFKKVERIIDFEKTDPKEHWYPIQKEITDYQKQVIQFSAELGNKIKHIKDINIIKKELDDYQDKIKEWETNNPNPLVKLDKFLEPLFSKFYLRIKVEPDDPDDIKFIPIESFCFDENQKEIKTDVHTRFLSTGTKQILSRTVPLFALKPKDTIILIDEPENSLYPNIQKDFIDFITLESWNESEKSCQFFFATHSPTIASSFDPWEVVELQFNKSGKVEQKLYYAGERRVENYIINPKYLRWDDILIEMFNSKFEGDEERNQKLQELSILERDIESGVYSGNKKHEMINKYEKIASLLNWKIEN